MKGKSLGTLFIGIVTLLTLVGCLKKNEKNELGLLVKMLPAQKNYLESEIIPNFEKAYNCKVRVQYYRSAADLKRILELDAKKSKPTISLVKTPFEATQQLVNYNLVQPFSNFKNNDDLEQDMAAYNDMAKAMGIHKNDYYYIPRKLETRILFYRKSMVKDALSKYTKHKSRINKQLKTLNGYGLPNGYELEKDPNEWDFYDIYVVGNIWANEEYYNGYSGKIAHRGDNYEGTGLFFVDRAFQLGASSDDILAMRGDAVTETYLWELASAKSGIYNKGVWEDKWRGKNIYNAIKDGKCFMAWFQQIDCFNVHGWEGDPQMPTYLEDPSDLGLAIIPKAVSFSLDANGKPLFEGNRKITTGGWWWGVAEKAPKAELAYEFAKYITNRTWNAKESSNFGMIPVRKDLLLNIQETYGMGWVGDIYKTSVMQIKQQVADSIIIVPRSKKYPQINENYINAFNSIVSGPAKNTEVNKEAVRKLLDGNFVPKAKEILGDEFPKEKTVETDEVSLTEEPTGK